MLSAEQNFYLAAAAMQLHNLLINRAHNMSSSHSPSVDEGRVASVPSAAEHFLKPFFAALVFGLIASALYGFWTPDFTRFVSFAGVSCMVAGASLGVGALLGFLFGIPRALANDKGAASEPVSSDQGEETNHGLHPLSKHYSPNTNLEQISDWLTKILVGVGLTQLVNAWDFLGNLATTAAAGMGEPATPVFAISLILYYLLCGFLFGYLWTRLKLAGAFLQADLSMFSARIQRSEELSRKAREQADIAVSAATIGVGKKTPSIPEKSVRSFVATPSVDEAVDDLLKKTTVNEDDPNKGQFGGQPKANGRVLEATVQAMSDQMDLCKVVLKVSSTDPSRKPLTGRVVFHLHPTFVRQEFPVNVNDQGVAELTLTAWGAFTVGAVADDGETRLELDLAELPDAPKKFRER